MPSLGGWEWVILALIALLLFGGSRLAGVGRNAGRAIRDFKEETSGSRSGQADPGTPSAQPNPTSTLTPPATSDPDADSDRP